jgi:hypothetical protein
MRFPSLSNFRILLNPDPLIYESPDTIVVAPVIYHRGSRYDRGIRANMWLQRLALIVRNCSAVLNCVREKAKKSRSLCSFGNII